MRGRHDSKHARRLAPIAAACLLCAAAAKPAEPKATRERADELEYQVAALQTLRELDVTAEQLAVIAAAAGKSAGKAAALPPVSAEYRAALAAFADALATGDEERIATAEDKVEDLREAEKVDPPPDVPPTKAAVAAAGKVVALLTAAQLAGYVAEHADEVPDPVQTLLDAADDGRGATGAEYESLKTEAADQFAMLVAGVDPAAAAPVAAAAKSWLDKAKHLSDGDYDAGQAGFAKQVKAMTNDVDAFAVLRHWTDREIVDLLVNPQLPAAVKRMKM